MSGWENVWVGNCRVGKYLGGKLSRGMLSGGKLSIGKLSVNRSYHHLLFYYKIINGFAPAYLKRITPNIVSNLHTATWNNG